MGRGKTRCVRWAASVTLVDWLHACRTGQIYSITHPQVPFVPNAAHDSCLIAAISNVDLCEGAIYIAPTILHRQVCTQFAWRKRVLNSAKQGITSQGLQIWLTNGMTGCSAPAVLHNWVQSCHALSCNAQPSMHAIQVLEKSTEKSCDSPEGVQRHTALDDRMLQWDCALHCRFAKHYCADLWPSICSSKVRAYNATHPLMAGCCIETVNKAAVAS